MITLLIHYIYVKLSNLRNVIVSKVEIYKLHNIPASLIEEVE